MVLVLLKVAMYLGFGYAVAGIAMWLLAHFLGWFFGEEGNDI